MRKVERQLLSLWQKAEQEGKRYFPHEFLYELLNSNMVADQYQIDPKNSWLIAAAERKLPIFVPGWEDSTCGNMFVSQVRKGNLKSLATVKSGLEYMDTLISWYEETAATKAPGFFQIGGGIAGDFPICVVPLLRLDLKRDVSYWAYFCQISDSTTSFGSYSGAVPNEKITWDKIDGSTPQFVIESDATIVAPLIFAYILGW
jgi:deoxyhypusine synthase